MGTIGFLVRGVAMTGLALGIAACGELVTQAAAPSAAASQGQPPPATVTVLYKTEKGEAKRAEVEVRSPVFEGKPGMPCTATRDGAKFVFSDRTLLDTASGRVIPLAMNACDATTDGRVAFTPDGKRLLGVQWLDDSKKETVLKAWDADTGGQLGTLDRHKSTSLVSASIICVNADGTLVATATMPFVRLYSLAGGSAKLLKTISLPPLDAKGNNGHFGRIAFSPDSRYLFAVCYLVRADSLRRLDLNATAPSLELVRNLDLRDNEIMTRSRPIALEQGVAFSPNDPVALIREGKFEQETWSFVNMLTGDAPKRVKSRLTRDKNFATYDPRGRCYEASLENRNGDDLLVLWDMDKDLPVVVLRGCAGTLIRFSADGHVAASSTKGCIAKWKLP